MDVKFIADPPDTTAGQTGPAGGGERVQRLIPSRRRLQTDLLPSANLPCDALGPSSNPALTPMLRLQDLAYYLAYIFNKHDQINKKIGTTTVTHLFKTPVSCQTRLCAFHHKSFDLNGEGGRLK